MPKFIQGDVIDLTPEQIAAIDWFVANPPKAYATLLDPMGTLSRLLLAGTALGLLYWWMSSESSAPQASAAVESRFYDVQGTRVHVLETNKSGQSGVQPRRRVPPLAVAGAL